jgi:CRISPR system Cascade subunit CasA
MNLSFDLVEQSWIPCIELGKSQPRLLSLREALCQASELTCVFGTTPPETAALYRLLLAVLYCALELGNVEESDCIERWKILWRDGWPTARLDEYLVYWQLQRRFNLFDPERPFFQDARLQRNSESVSSLVVHVAAGNDPTLFDHHTETERLVLKPDEATRALVTIQAFGLGGTKGPADNPNYPPFNNAPCARGAIFLMEGQTLFETLMLNLFDPDMPSNRFPPRAKYGDRPAWEMDDPFEDDPARPYGYLDYVTWHNRRVRLFPSVDLHGQVVVQEMMYAPGLKSYGAKGASVRETFNPLMHWIPSKKPKRPQKGGERPSHHALLFDEEKALWRDSATLLRLPAGDDETMAKPPRCLNWVRDLVRERFLETDQAYRYLSLGMCTKPGQDKVYFYRMEAIPLPPEILKKDELVSRLSQALEAADGVGKLVRSKFPSAVYTLARFVIKPTTSDSELDRLPDSEEVRKRIENLANSWSVERDYWSRLELHFHRLVHNLPQDPEPALDEWRTHLRRAANSAFERVEAYVGQDRRTQRAAVKAREQFDRELDRILSIKQREETHEQEST